MNTLISPAAVPAITQEQLRALWQQVLELDSVGPDDNFFDVGGCSFAAMRLSLELESRHGLKFDIASIFQHPTVHEQCRLLQAAPISPVVRLRHFVPLQTEGKLPPLFCVAHAPYLGPSRPVYCFPGLYDRIHATHEDWSPDDLDRVVEGCQDDVNAVAPRGPIHLNGYCHGAWLVLALAQRLTAAGRQVPYVGLVEAYPRPEWSWSGWTRALLQSSLSESGSSATDSTRLRNVARGVYHSGSRGAHRLALRWTKPESRLRRAWLGVCNTFSRSELPAEERLRYFQNVDVYRSFARQVFRQGSPVRVDLYLRSDGLSGKELSQRVREWESAVCDGVVVHRIQGDHVTIRQKDNLQVLAERVSARLREVEASL
jgi:thioesterase domain-containing protein/aryl carrier-like protein